MLSGKDQYYIDKVRTGDVKAFAVLVDHYKNMVYTIVLRITGNREDAEEVAQDVFLKAYQKLDKFRGDSKFSTWLYRIAFNEAVSKTRKRSLITTQIKENLEESLSEDIGTHEILGLNPGEQRDLIGLVLMKLNELEKTLVTLYYLESGSIEEVSQITGMTTSNVKVKLHRTRKKMYQIMNRSLQERVHTLN